ncbi:hypothetical protein HBA55_36490 [Pseudomaricurvus alkylphenolicus]|uniref:hypothetical protein n=1 Tax=Pseudomaricurvus alkylphenolicus TaxID=1306991 RepID=UPI00141EEE9A|nr:hypothetical protein [Pseudomaricurvus alkylphenolicus]NIB45135.1 hypothetical protein [Pseudomaricurvus alkylphenolicus]
MPFIFYRSSDYVAPYLHLNTDGESSIRCKKLDLYRSMITVGNPSFISKRQIKDYGLARAIYSSVIEKIGVVFENIQSDREGMRLHPIYHTHVSDKKRIVSYNLGMAFAKFYAERLLDIGSLIHVEGLKTLGAIQFDTPNEGRGREPDLVGQCANGHWHVFEAKGMSTNQLNSKIASAKEQAQQIASIDGTTPRTLNACATYFSDKRILTHLADPESKEERSLNISREKFIDSNYRSIFLIEDALERKLELIAEDNFRYYGVNLEANGVNLKVGIEEEIHDLLKQKEFSKIPQFSRSRYAENAADQRVNNLSMGFDGIVVKYRDY